MPVRDEPIPRTGESDSLFDARLAALLEAAPDALVCVEPSGRIAQLNSRVGLLLGYERDELLGAKVELLLPEVMRGRHVHHRAGFVAHPRVRSMGSGMALVARRRDGGEIPVEVSLVPWLAGEPGWVIAAIRDVTGQRALEAKSLENEARLRQVAESVDLVFMLLQLEPLEYLYVSPKAQSLIGAGSHGTARGDLTSVMALVHPEDRAGVEQGFLRDAHRGVPAESEHRLLTRDGQVVWVRVVATPVRDVDGGPPRRTVITMEDVTKRILVVEALRAAEAAARAANDSKNHFLSRMSHELRTPLNAVMGFGQLLSRQLAGTEYAEAVSFVLTGGQHLLELINDVLDIARIESGEMSLSLEPIHLATLVDETLQLMTPLAAATDVTLLPAVGAPDVLVLADRQRVRQILLNVLSNAVKYNKHGGHVWVSWALADGEVLLSVRDEGAGVAPELQGRLFHPFDRLGAERTQIEGAGIGLALTRSLAELMNGSVGVTSTPGHGATFTVTLPARSGTLPEPPPQAASTTGSRVDVGCLPAGGTATLVYIEDNAPNVRVVEHLLALRPGWRMFHAPLGGLGVDLVRTHHPDLVLLDLHLPDQHGSEVLSTLKRSDDTKDIPVVIVTADATPGQAARLVQAGADRFITKPLDVEAVVALLDEVSRERFSGEVETASEVGDV